MSEGVMRRRAKILVSLEYLVTMCQPRAVVYEITINPLPEDCELISWGQVPFGPREIELLLESPAFALVREGEEPILAPPLMRRIYRPDYSTPDAKAAP